MPFNGRATRRLLKYLKAYGRWVLRGRPTVTRDQYIRRVRACYRCEHVNATDSPALDECKLCECLIADKAAMATEVCPDTPPHWEIVTLKPIEPVS